MNNGALAGVSGCDLSKPVGGPIDRILGVDGYRGVVVEVAWIIGQRQEAPALPVGVQPRPAEIDH